MARFVVLSFSGLERPVNSQGDFLPEQHLPAASSSSLSPSPLVDRLGTDRGKVCLQTGQVSWTTRSLTPLNTAFEWCAAVANVCVSRGPGRRGHRDDRLCSALGAGLSDCLCPVCFQSVLSWLSAAY